MMGKTVVFWGIGILVGVCLLFCGILCSSPAYASSITITSKQSISQQSYTYARLADLALHPDNSAFDWESLASFLGEHNGYPELSRNGGADFIQKLSADIEANNRDVLVLLKDYVKTDAAGDFTGRVSGLEPGWYILFADTGLPILTTLTADQDVSIAEKTDTPTISKEIITGDTGAAISGISNVAPKEFQLRVTLPSDIDTYETYELRVTDAWDAPLTFVAKSLAVSYQHADGTRTDVTGYESTISDTSLTLLFPDIKKDAPRGDDVLIVRYKLLLPYGKETPNELLNSAFATYSKHNGKGTTTTTTTKLYPISLVVKKVSTTSEPLAGAEFGLKNEEGAWLGENMAFGSDTPKRFVSGADGLVSGLPLLDTGTYTLVELKAPEGYEQGAYNETEITFTLQDADDTVGLQAQAHGSVKSIDVDKDINTVYVEIENHRTPIHSLLPKTGESEGVLLIVLLGIAVSFAMVSRFMKGRERDENA